MVYVGIAAIVIVIVFEIIYTAKRNNELKTGGIEADAVVTRVQETVNTDTDGSFSSVSNSYYVTYRTLTGETVEAKLGSGKSIDTNIGKSTWDQDLHEGSRVRIKYLPEKTNYVIRI